MILREPAQRLDPRVRQLWAVEWLAAAAVAAVATVTIASLLAMADNDRAAAIAGTVRAVVTFGLVLLALVQPRVAYRWFG